MATAAAKVKESTFQVLNEINISDKTERKGSLTYLSWPNAWGELLKHYPDSTYMIYENKDGWNYHHDGRTAWVKTGVTVDGKEYIEMLPVMNMRNQSIPLNELTSTDVNKAIQRSLVKAIAKHGLGLYIYAGEDMPETEQTAIKEKEAALKTKRDMVTAEIKRATKQGTDKPMSRDEMIEFRNKYLVPILGSESYTVCTDMSKLDALIEALKDVA